MSSLSQLRVILSTGASDKYTIHNPAPYSPYNASKVALNSYTDALGHESKEESIQVNAVTPGITATKLDGFLGNRMAEDGGKVLLPFALLGAGVEVRTGEPCIMGKRMIYSPQLLLSFYNPDGECLGRNT
ncbi:hypothetical protein HHX47_DHR6000546 [Lentinula edodes]|nr:hypothetical protein HHX47_DHR6000546 [Lentinula edodes]